jgi:hypothetical protein
MSSTGDVDDDNLGGDESKKSERKRQRERQRRSDLANAFDELSSLLADIEPDDSDSGSNRRRRRKSEGGAISTADLDQAADNSGMTRLDLIGRSVEALRRLHGENTELKRVVEQQREGRDDKVIAVLFAWVVHLDAASVLMPHIIFKTKGSTSNGTHAHICGSRPWWWARRRT